MHHEDDDALVKNRCAVSTGFLHKLFLIVIIIFITAIIIIVILTFFLHIKIFKHKQKILLFSVVVALLLL